MGREIGHNYFLHSHVSLATLAHVLVGSCASLAHIILYLYIYYAYKIGDRYIKKGKVGRNDK